jgi:release factor glutamine methyltransferase
VHQLTYSELFTRSLKHFNGENKSLEVQMLLEAVFNLTRVQFWTHKDREITDPGAVKTFERYIRRLKNGEPVAYILNQKEFYGELFYVDQRVLIPRPETEILVEKALQVIRQHATESPVTLLDIGAGSGIISIIIAKNSEAEVTALEFSRDAFSVLNENIRQHKLREKITAIYADLFPSHYPQDTSPSAGRRFDIIVSNPPYIPEHEWQELDSTVKDFEPKMALAAGEDGLDIIRRIVSEAPQNLVPGGTILMEIGYNQKEPVATILREAGFKSIDFINDYGSIPRIACARRPQQ